MNWSARAGVALTELAIAMLVLAGVLVPLAGAFTKGKVQGTLSRMNYTALVAARAQLEELRALDWERLEDAKHDWLPLPVRVFAITEAARAAGPSVAQDLALVLPADYQRIETRLDLGEVQKHERSLTRHAVLRVRWQEAGTIGKRSPEAVLATVLACHKPVWGVR